MNQPIPGGTNVLSKLQVLNNPDRPVVDMQHIEGGKWSVASLADRDAIPALLRQKNVTECFVEALGTSFVLRGGITNDNWLEVAQVVATGSEVLRLKNYDEGDWIFEIGQPATVGKLLDNYYFHIPAGRTIVTRYVRGLPDGVGIDENGRFVGELTQTQPSQGMLIYSVRDSAGDGCQIILGYKVVPKGGRQQQGLGNIMIDILFEAMSADQQTVAFDYDLALQINQPGFVLHNARCYPSGVANTRFIGTTAVAECVAIAAIAKATPEAGGRNRFYRFGISTAVLQAKYPGQASIRFEVMGKYKAGNAAASADGANNARFALSNFVSDGLQAAAAPIGFVAKNSVTQPVVYEYTNGGRGYGATESETRLAYVDIDLVTGAATLTVTAPAPGTSPPPATPQFIIIDGPLPANAN